jgi:uncharacterized protein
VLRAYNITMRHEHPYQGQNPWAPARAGVTAPDTRDQFITRTYNHVFLAIALFAAIEIALFMTGLAPVIASVLFKIPLVAFGGFVLVSWLATSVAYRAESKAAQYAALFGFVAAEALFFLPLLMFANAKAPGAIQSAGVVTLVGFAGLTGLAHWTKKDFTFLGSILRWISFGVLGLIVASLIFGFTLGTLFSVGMVVFAGAAILYETSRIQREFPEHMHVAAALSLFSSVAMMFWYVLRIFVGARR